MIPLPSGSAYRPNTMSREPEVDPLVTASPLGGLARWRLYGNRAYVDPGAWSVGTWTGEMVLGTVPVDPLIAPDLDKAGCFGGEALLIRVMHCNGAAELQAMAARDVSVGTLPAATNVRNGSRLCKNSTLRLGRRIFFRRCLLSRRTLPF